MRSSILLSKFIRESFDDRDVGWHFLYHAEKEVAAAGITLSLERDFEAYVATNRENRDSWFAPMPMFNPDYGDLSRAFWIKGVDQRGRTVVVQAARCFGLTGSNLAEAIETLEIFYDDPSASAAPLESCSCDAPSASRMGGTICYSGGGWYHRDHRGRHFSSLMPRISRVMALLLWNTHYTVSFIEKPLVDRGVVARYGYRNVEPGIEWRNAKSEPRLSLYLVWMDRCELLWGLCQSMELTGEVRAQPRRPKLKQVAR